MVEVRRSKFEGRRRSKLEVRWSKEVRRAKFESRIWRDFEGRSSNVEVRRPTFESRGSKVEGRRSKFEG